MLKKVFYSLSIFLISLAVYNYNFHTFAEESDSGTCRIRFDSERDDYVFDGNNLPASTKVVLERFETPGGWKETSSQITGQLGFLSYRFKPTDGISKTLVTVYPDVPSDQPVPKELCAATYDFTTPNASPTQSPALTPNPIAPPKPADVKVFIISEDGESNDQNQSFYPGEEVKIFGRLFSSDANLNNQYKNLDGCVPTAQDNLLIFTITDGHDKEVKKFQNPACIAESFTIPEEASLYKVKTQLVKSEGYLGASYGQLVFEVSKEGRIQTDIIPQINGYTSAEIYEIPERGYVDIAGRVYAHGDQNLACLVVKINIEWTKIEDENGPISNPTPLVQEPVINCNTDPVKGVVHGRIDGFGTYRLRVQYVNPGNDKYKTSERTEGLLKVIKKPLVVTTTDVGIEPATLAKASGGGYVAGIAIEKEGASSYKVRTDPNGAKGIKLVACTKPENGTTADIAFNTLTVIKIDENGLPTSPPLLDGSHVNCEPETIGESELLGADRLEIRAKYDSQGYEPYASSEEEVTLDIDAAHDGTDQVEPFVLLSSNPQVISPSDFNGVTIIATTNTPVASPQFALFHDGTSLSPAQADRANNDCEENKNTFCRYEADFHTLDSGNYTVQFCNAANLCDTLSFQIGNEEAQVLPTPTPEPSEEIPAPEVSQVELKDETTGDIYSLPLDGTLAGITLSGSPDETRTHIFSVLVRYKDDSTADKGSITILYEPVLQPTPTPTPVPQEETQSPEESTPQPTTEPEPTVRPTTCDPQSNGPEWEYQGCGPTCPNERWHCTYDGQVYEFPNTNGECACQE